MKIFSPSLVRQVLLLSVIVLLGLLIFNETRFLIVPFLGAITLYILLRSVMSYLVNKKKYKKWLAALVLIFSSVLFICLPLVWAGSVMYKKFVPFIENPQQLMGAFETIHQYLMREYDVDIFNQKNLNEFNQFLFSFSRKALSNSLNIIGQMFMTFFLLYFLLVQNNQMDLYMKKILPLKRINSNKLINELKMLIYSNAVGIPLVAVVQGITGMLGYLIFGIKEFILMGILTAITSVIPFVGSMLVYIPLGIYELASGRVWQGTAVLLWGFLLIGSVDNVARFLLQKRMSGMHPLITVIGVIVGINLFGFIGIVFGPILISMFILMVKIYTDEYGELNVENN